MRINVGAQSDGPFFFSFSLGDCHSNSDSLSNYSGLSNFLIFLLIRFHWRYSVIMFCSSTSWLAWTSEYVLD
jgi:hypothetical protein